MSIGQLAGNQKELMTRRKVLVLIKGYLLNAGVQSLLSEQEDLQVLARSIATDVEMIRAIEAFRPDAVVLDESQLRQRANALALSFAAYPALRAIIVNLDDNTIEICDKKTVVINNLDDFLAAIRQIDNSQGSVEARR